MKQVPFSYIARNLWVRRVTTALTAIGLALVVYVFATVLMMSEGIKATLVATGQADNVIVIRKGSGSEISSGIDRVSASIVESSGGIATEGTGQRLVSKEPVVVINLERRNTGKPSNVTVRGIGPLGAALRPQVRITEGRMFRPGTNEVVAGSSIAAGFSGAGIGETLRFAGRDWVVVGVMDGGKTAFDSEVWGDAEQMMQGFRRLSFSTVIFRLADPNDFDRVKAALDNDPRLQLDVKREQQFYSEQSEALATFIRVLGLTISVIFSIGAIVGAMITMFATVAQRVGEIGTLRALGFRRSAVLIAFLIESLLLSLVGGLIGLLGASLMQNFSLSTVNFSTFAEIAFGFVLTPSIVVQTLIFSLVMGLVGGFLPARRASKLKIVDALREA